MALPSTVKDYLDKWQLPYRLISYPGNGTLQQISEAIHIPASRLIRAVLLSDGQSGHLMAVLPSNYILDFSLLRRLAGRDLLLPPAEESTAAFKECQPGSRPPLPSVFDLPAVAEETLATLEGDIYFDAGSHDALVCMNSADYRRLLGVIEWGHFSIPVDTLDLLQQQAVTPEDLLEITSSFTPRQLEKAFKELPPLPAEARRVLELRAGGAAGSHNVAAFLNGYPQLANAIIRYAGSPLYVGHMSQVESIEEAVALVGVDIAAGLGFGVILGRAFQIPQDGPLGCKAFWRHAVYCAALTRELARFLPVDLYLQPGLVYWGGLLHKFGYLVLAQLFPAQYFLLNRFLNLNNQIAIEQLETHLLGVDNRQMGAWLMRAWKMPKELTAAVCWHRQEDYSQPYAEYPNLVLIANRLLHNLGIGDETSDRLPIAIMYSLGLAKEQALVALAKVKSSRDALENLARALAA